MELSKIIKELKNCPGDAVLRVHRIFDENYDVKNVLLEKNSETGYWVLQTQEDIKADIGEPHDSITVKMFLEIVQHLSGDTWGHIHSKEGDFVNCVTVAVDGKSVVLKSQDDCKIKNLFEEVSDERLAFLAQGLYWKTIHANRCFVGELMPYVKTMMNILMENAGIRNEEEEKMLNPNYNHENYFLFCSEEVVRMVFLEMTKRFIIDRKAVPSSFSDDLKNCNPAALLKIHGVSDKDSCIKQIKAIRIKDQKQDVIVLKTMEDIDEETCEANSKTLSDLYMNGFAWASTYATIYLHSVDGEKVTSMTESADKKYIIINNSED